MIGQTLSQRYEVQAELGRGGMGVVYRARDTLLNRDVAVKLIPPTLLTPESEERFRREAQLVAQMDYASIVSIYDLGHHQGSLFLVMPLVQGSTLRSFLREGSPSLGDVIDAGIELAEALDYSHARGVVHRDIKPENVMIVREESGRVRVRVMDFGLARAAGEGRITTTGALVGTLAYLSPEQVAKREVDSRCDIYSLGTVLYECVVGAPPFSGEVEALLYRIVHEIPQPPRAMGALIDEEMETLILACLEKEPARRPQRAAEVAAALRRYRWRLRENDLARLVFAQTAPIERPPLAPFIGRGKEFAELQQRLNLALSGECQFVLVAGEPGIGKTRLLEELEKLARARGIRVLRGRSVEQDRSFPYQGFCELIQAYFRLKETGSSALPDLSDLAPDLVSLFPTLGEIADVRSAATRYPTLERPAAGSENQTHVFELLARTLARIAGGRPLVLLFEDLHGAEVSVEALQYVARRLGPTPTLIVGTYHSTEIDGLHPLVRMVAGFRGDRRFCCLSLGPFAPAEHRAFLESLVGGHALSEDLAERLYQGTAGNPFFTKELVPSLLGTGTITTDEAGIWRLSGDALSPGALPATIQEAVEKRIERLPQEQREILQVAAVIGRTFSTRDLETLAEGKGDVEDALDHLIKEGLVQEERESRGGMLAFSSGLVRDVLYVALPRRKRRLLHRRYAEQMEARHKGRLERAYPQLVHHFTQGDVPDKAVGYGLELARKSLEAFSPENALRALKTVLEYVEDEAWSGDRHLEGEARVLLASAQGMLGDFDGALREAEAAARIFEEIGEAARHAAACLLAAETAWRGRRIAETRTWLEAGIAAARAAGESETLVRVLALGVTVANLRGEYACAKEYLDEADRLAAGTSDKAGDEELPRGGRLVVGLVNPVRAKEPGDIAIIEEEEVLLSVFEPLLAADAEGNLVPRLCEAWEALEDGTSFRLSLRRGVRFHDGCPLTAGEVKASFERSIRRARGELPAAYAAIRGACEHLSGEAEGVVGLVAHSDHTLEVRLSEPLPIFPALLTDSLTGIARAAADEGSALMGTGPFRLVTHDPTHVLLERSPDYWSQAASLDAIEFKASLTASAIASGLRSGDLDLARDLLLQDLDEVLRDPRFRHGLVEVPKKNVYFVLFNCKSRDGPASNPAVRRALGDVVRTYDLVWRTLGRFAQPAAGLLPPGILGHDPGRRREPMDREQAVAKLAEAGVATPIRLRAAVHPLLQDRYGSLTKALREIWSELGVEVEVATSTLEAFLNAFEAAGDFDLMIARWNADYADPDNFTHGLFHSRAGVFRRYYSSEETDRLAEQARAEPRTEAREGLYRQFEGLLLETGALLPLFHDIDYRIASPRVRRLRLRGNPPYVNYSELGKIESPAAAPAVRSGGGVLHVPIGGVLASLDPSLAWTVEQSEVIPNIFETLTRDLEGARIVPWLASELSVEDGGRRFRFRLREGIRFHDGRRLTARDVRYSWERLLRLRHSAFHFLSPIRGAKALMEGGSGELAGFRILSAAEFSVDLEEPVSFFPVLLSHAATAIVPEGSDPGDPRAACGGTGPFRVVQFEPGQRVQLERNPSYWRSGYPRSDGLVFHLGVPPETIFSEFRAGRLHLASDLFPHDVEVLRQEPEFASGYREAPSLSTYLLAFNASRGPLADAALRRRLARALDVDALVRRTLGFLAIPAQGLIPPGLLGYEPTHRRAGAGASPTGSGAQEAAVALELTAAVHPVFLGEYAALAEEVCTALRAQGVQVRRVSETMSEYLEVLRTGAVDLVMGRWEADYPDADTFVHGLLQPTAGFFGRICGTAEIDVLAQRGRAETDPAVRHTLYRRVEEILVRDVLLVPLFHEQVYRFARPEVEGLELRISRPAVAYETLAIRR